MKKFLKRSLPFLATLLLAFFIFRKGVRWNDLKMLVGQANWGWLLIALFWQAGAYAAVTWLNETLLRQYKARVPFGKQYVIQIAMAFIEAIVPSATISGAVLRIRLLKPHGVSADVATVTTLAEMTLIFLSVIVFSLPIIGLAVLNKMVGASSFLHWGIALLIGVIVILILASQWRKPIWFGLRARLYHLLSSTWDRSIRPHLPRQVKDWTMMRIRERILYLGTELLVLLRGHPYPILLSLLARFAFEALGLTMCFMALGQTLPFSVMLLAYVLTMTVNMLGAVPGGLGLTEVSLAALYAQFGLPVGIALAVALAYRLTDYWLPRLIGGAAWLWLEGKSPWHTLKTNP